jgi:hypothetical protein
MSIFSYLKTLFDHRPNERTNDPTTVTRELPTVEVPPTSSANVSVETGEKFWPNSLTIPHDVAEHFYVIDVKMDENSQFVSPGCLPALVFSDQATSEELDLAPLQTQSSRLTITVVNIASTTKTFKGTVKGTKTSPAPDKPKKIYIGLGSTYVNPHQSFNVSAQLHDKTKLSRLIVPSSIADHFTITHIKTSYLLDSAPETHLNKPTPATVYVEHVTNLVDLSICVESSAFITLTAENTGDNPQNFSGAFIGRVLPPTNNQFAKITP